MFLCLCCQDLMVKVHHHCQTGASGKTAPARPTLQSNPSILSDHVLLACYCLQAANPEAMGAGVDGNLCVYEVAHTYLPIKYLSTTTHHHPGCIAAAPDSSLLATVSRSDASPTVMLVSSALDLRPSVNSACSASQQLVCSWNDLGSYVACQQCKTICNL